MEENKNNFAESEDAVVEETVDIDVAESAEEESGEERPAKGEKKKLISEIERIEKKLANQGFVAKAPAAVIEGEKLKMAKYQENLDGVIAALSKLG